MELVDGLIDRNPVNPAEQLAVRVVAIQVLEHLEKRRLGHVGRVVPVAQDAEGRVPDRALVALDQLQKCPPVPAPAALDQFQIDVLRH
ncbi:hypothetical protein D3C83_101120 [compost metagenome]